MKIDKVKQFQWRLFYPQQSKSNCRFIWKDESAKNYIDQRLLTNALNRTCSFLKMYLSWTGCWWFSLHACLIHPWRHHHHHLVSRLTADVYKVATTIPKRNTFWRLSSSESTVASNHKFHSFLAGNKRRHNRVI